MYLFFHSNVMCIDREFYTEWVVAADHVSYSTLHSNFFKVLIMETFFKYSSSSPSSSHRQPTWASWTIENRKSKTWTSTPETAPSILECLWRISANGRNRRSPNSWRNGWRRISGTHSDTAGHMSGSKKTLRGNFNTECFSSS